MLPFKQKYRWWASVDLGRRILLVLFVISIPQNEVNPLIKLQVIVISHFSVAVSGYHSTNDNTNHVWIYPAISRDSYQCIRSRILCECNHSSFVEKYTNS